MCVSSQVTVALYLQDHTGDDDERALQLRTRSQQNTCFRTNYANYSVVRAHPRKGDAIVFDSRIFHRGQSRAFANFRRSTRGPHRTLVTLNYGLRNAFSDGYDRGFAMRNLLFNNVTLCGGNIDGGKGGGSLACSKRVIAADIKASPVPRSLRKLAPAPG